MVLIWDFNRIGVLNLNLNKHMCHVHFRKTRMFQVASCKGSICANVNFEVLYSCVFIGNVRNKKKLPAVNRPNTHMLLLLPLSPGSNQSTKSLEFLDPACP